MTTDREHGGLRFRALSEIGPIPPRRATIADLLAPGDLALLTGAPKCGKSTLAAVLAASVSRGGPFLGRPCQPGTVIYVAAERGEGVVRRLRAAGAEPNKVILVDGTPDLMGGADAIIEGIEGAHVKPALIILDTFARSIAGADENSARDMGVALKALTAIQRSFPSAATVVIHHVGKNGGSARGSSALTAGTDMELKVDVEKGRRQLSVGETNYAPEKAIAFRLEAVELDDGEEVTAVPDDGPVGANSAPGDGLADVRAKRSAERCAWIDQMDRALPSSLPSDPDERRDLAIAAAKEIGRIKPDTKRDTARKIATRLLNDVLDKRSQEAVRYA